MERVRQSVLDITCLAMLFKNNPFVSKYIKTKSNESHSRKATIKCYFCDLNQPYLLNNIFVLVKCADDVNFNNLNEIFTKNKDFEKCKFIFIEHVQFAVYSFQFPFKYKKDLNLIQEGSWSKIDNETKNMIMKYWNLSKKSKTYLSLYNVDDAKNKNGIPMIRNEVNEYINIPNEYIPLESIVYEQVA